MKKVIGLVLLAIIAVAMAIVTIVNGDIINATCASAYDWIKEKFFNKEEKSK